MTDASNNDSLAAPALVPQRRISGFAASFPERLTHVAGVMLYTSFAEAETAWRAFEADAAGTAFQSFDWLSAWHAHVGAARGVKPAIVMVARQGAPVLLAAFGIDRYMGMRRLSFMGGDMADYKGPLLVRDFDKRVPKGDFPAMWRQIRRALPRHDLVLLENQPVSLGSPDRPVHNPFVELPSVAAPDAAYVFDLPDSFETFSQRYRAETRRIDRSKMRKLEAAGDVTFRFAETCGDMVSMTEDILARKAAQLAAQGISSSFSEAGTRAAWRELASLPEEQRLLEVAELRLDGEFLSGSIAHVWHGRSTLMVHTYEGGRHHRLSPGRLHLLKLLQSSIDRGIAVYDLSVGYLPYKESFCDTPMELRNSIAATTLLGSPAAATLRGWYGLKRRIKSDPRLMGLVQRLRAGLKA